MTNHDDVVGAGMSKIAAAQPPQSPPWSGRYWTPDGWAVRSSDAAEAERLGTITERTRVMTILADLAREHPASQLALSLAYERIKAVE